MFLVSFFSYVYGTDFSWLERFLIFNLAISGLLTIFKNTPECVTFKFLHLYNI
jgi:hypothetical protein